MRRLVALAVVLWAAPALASPFTVLVTSETRAGNLRRITSVVQNGDDPLDRFGVERVVKLGSDQRHLRGAIVLVPALSFAARSYTLGDAFGGADFENSIAAHLAEAQLDVYIYDPRESFLAPGACDTIDCSPMAHWGVQARLDDLVYVRQEVARIHGGRLPVIGGFSLGGVTSLAAVNQDPQAWAGVVDLDGPLIIEDAALSASFGLLCGGLQAAIAAGQVFLDNSVNQAVVALGVTDPDGLTPAPGFPPGTTNRQVYLLLVTTPAPVGPPATFVPQGFMFDAGSVAENRFFFASEDRLATLFLVGQPNVPNREIADFVCAFAGDTTFTAHLGDFHGPTLAFEIGLGWGTRIQASLDALGGPVTRIDHPAFGHADLFASPNHAELFEDEILKWIDRAHVF